MAQPRIAVERCLTDIDPLDIKVLAEVLEHVPADPDPINGHALKLCLVGQ